jgi:hypothetical protein
MPEITSEHIRALIEDREWWTAHQEVAEKRIAVLGGDRFAEILWVLSELAEKAEADA